MSDLIKNLRDSCVSEGKTKTAPVRTFDTGGEMMTDSERITALERRVAELEKQRMWHIPQMPTFPQPFGGVIGLQAPATPIRTDEVTCTGEKK